VDDQLQPVADHDHDYDYDCVAGGRTWTNHGALTARSSVDERR
jgi:hypothetical protein